MKPLSEVPPRCLIIQIQIQAVWGDLDAKSVPSKDPPTIQVIRPSNVSDYIVYIVYICTIAEKVWTEPRTTDTRWLNSQFFVAQIQIPIPNKYLGFG